MIVATWLKVSQWRAMVSTNASTVLFGTIRKGRIAADVGSTGVGEDSTWLETTEYRSPDGRFDQTAGGFFSDNFGYVLIGFECMRWAEPVPSLRCRACSERPIVRRALARPPREGMAEVRGV